MWNIRKHKKSHWWTEPFPSALWFESFSEALAIESHTSCHCHILMEVDGRCHKAADQKGSSNKGRWNQFWPGIRFPSLLSSKLLKLSVCHRSTAVCARLSTVTVLPQHNLLSRSYKVYMCMWIIHTCWERETLGSLILPYGFLLYV